MDQLQYSEEQRETVLSRAAEVLAARRAIVFPSDTVYALLAAVDSPEAYQEIFQLKQRDLNQPLQLLASPDHPSVAEIVRLLEKHEDEQEAFLCGQLTAVFPAGTVKMVPPAAQSIQPGSVGIRLPSWEPLSELCRRCGGLLWGTSANLSGTDPVKDLSGITEAVRGLAAQPGLVVTINAELPGTVSNVLVFSNDGVNRIR